MIESATVTSPEMLGLLVWWIVMLAAPVIVVRRWRRRDSAAHRPYRRLRLMAHVARRVRGAGRPAVRRATLVQISEPSASAPTPNREAAADRSARGSSAAAAFVADSSAAGRSRPAPPLTAPRLLSGTLEPLCRYVDFQRRLALAASELRAMLAPLPATRWRIEPYPLTGERRNTFVIIGETGIFVISATYAPGHWDDVIAVSRLARKIQQLLPGYSGQVQRAVCHPFTATRPRIWHRPDEDGAWVGAWLIGGDSVIEWLEHFGPDHGLSAADLARFDELARPNWLTGAIPTPPSWPPIRDAAAPDWEG